MHIRTVAMVAAVAVLTFAGFACAEEKDSKLKSADQPTGQAESSKNTKPTPAEGGGASGSHGPTGSKSGPAVKPTEKNSKSSDQN